MSKGDLSIRETIEAFELQILYDKAEHRIEISATAWQAVWY